MLSRSSQIKLKGVLETHVHADFVSGHVELNHRVGTTVFVSEAAGAKYAHYPVIDGEVLALSEKYAFMALSTPGHTLGCITWLLVDRMRDNLPVMVTILWAPCVNLTCLRHSPEIIFLLALLVDLISWEVWAIRKRLWLPCYSTVCTTSSFACQMTVLFIPRMVQDHHVDRV